MFVMEWVSLIGALASVVGVVLAAILYHRLQVIQSRQIAREGITNMLTVLDCPLGEFVRGQLGNLEGKNPIFVYRHEMMSLVKPVEKWAAKEIRRGRLDYPNLIDSDFHDTVQVKILELLYDRLTARSSSRRVFPPRPIQLFSIRSRGKDRESRRRDRSRERSLELEQKISWNVELLSQIHTAGVGNPIPLEQEYEWPERNTWVDEATGLIYAEQERRNPDNRSLDSRGFAC